MSNSVTPWTVARQALLSMDFSWQECWSGLPCSPLGDLPNPGIEPISLRSPALADRFFTIRVTWEAPDFWILGGVFWRECGVHWKGSKIQNKAKSINGSSWCFHCWRTTLSHWAIDTLPHNTDGGPSLLVTLWWEFIPPTFLLRQNFHIFQWLLLQFFPT